MLAKALAAGARQVQIAAKCQINGRSDSSASLGGIGMATAHTATAGDHAGLLDKARIIAHPGYNRWLVPPAGLAIHLCIGMAYGFSVFWKPLQGALLGAYGKPVPECAAGAVTFGEKSVGTLDALTATSCNWSQFDLGWMYT